MFNKLNLSLISAIAMIVVSYNGCSGFTSLSTNIGTINSSSTAASGQPAAAAAPGIESFKATVYPLLRTNCVGCHATSKIPLHSSADPVTAYNGAFTKLSLTKPDESLLVQKSGDGHCKVNPPIDTMNCLDHMAKFKAAVITWAAHETSNTGGVLQAAGNSRLRLGNRRFVSSKLNDLFGSVANTPVNEMVATKYGVFGGPCDKYRADFSTYGGIYGVPKGDCDNIANSQSSVIAPNTAPRLALVNRVCNRILQEDTSVHNIVTKGFGSTSPISARRPNDTDLQTLYGLFFTGRLADSTVISGLRGLSDKAQSLGYTNIESWRFSLIALCQSPDWQIP